MRGVLDKSIPGGILAAIFNSRLGNELSTTLRHRKQNLSQIGDAKFRYRFLRRDRLAERPSQPLQRTAKRRPG